jgi:D-arabinan exo alpha-(1,3)/(1,5)-arabinofuranosidase (non-reducing end)
MRTLASLWLSLFASSLLFGQELSRYPILPSDVQAHYLSSTDRTGGNDDGFDGTYSELYTDENGEHVILDVEGPGTLYNLWFTSRVNGWSPLGSGRIKLYFDGEPAPRVDMDIDEFFSGRRPPFVPPFVYDAFQSTGGYVSYMPFPFRKHLKVTTERRVGFYNAYYHTYAPDHEVDSWTADAPRWDFTPGALPEGELARGTVRLPAPAMPDGEMVPSRAVVLERKGGGAITSLRFNPLFPLSAYELNHLLLRIYWDGEDEPSVAAPLGSFFGSGLGEASVQALPLGMSPSGAYYCRFPMPFWDGFRIELVNENPGASPEIWWEVRMSPAGGFSRETSGTFHAVYHREWPTTEGRDYTLLDAAGRGLYLGQVMTVEPLRAEIKRWWEGDLRIYLDARRQPAFLGTGHEDEYLGGWSNEWLMNPYSLPMHGEPKTSGLRQVDFQWSAATTVYRFFVSGVPFQNGISVSTEHGARNTAEAMYSSVAYYYGRPDAFQKLDELEVDGALELTSEFEGRDDEVTVTDRGRAVEVGGRSSFSLEIPAGASHLRLRRLFDQKETQEAEVLVNGKSVGLWYTATTNPYKRWAESDFLLPDSASRGAKRLDFEIRVLRPGWNEFRYELWGKR